MKSWVYLLDISYVLHKHLAFYISTPEMAAGNAWQYCNHRANFRSPNIIIKLHLWHRETLNNVQSEPAFYTYIMYTKMNEKCQTEHMQFF